MKVYNNTGGSTGTTSKGNQLKIEVDNIWYKADFLGYEGAAEFFCSKILAATNIQDFVEYEMEKISYNKKEYNGCKSKNFLGKNEEIITAAKLFKIELGESIDDLIKNKSTVEKIRFFVNKIEEITQIEDFGKELTLMLEWDAFVLNEDRHYNNIAFIRNLDTNTFKVAPLFDNGAAFLSDLRSDYPIEGSEIDYISSVKSKPFSKNFKKQVEAAKKLYGSQFKYKENLNIVRDAINDISQFYGEWIAKRIQNIYFYQRKRIQKEYTQTEEPVRKIKHL